MDGRDEHHIAPLLDASVSSTVPEYVAAPATAPAPSAAFQSVTASESGAECPFYMVMGQVAGTAVRQQVYHIEGEVLPRVDLVRRLEDWQQLYHLVQTRICPATRAAPLTPAQVAALVEVALPRLVPDDLPPDLHTRLQRQLVACATCISPQQCPLGQLGQPSDAP